MTMVALLLAVAAGHAAAVDLDLYLTAARSGVAGEVAGRAYEERRRLDRPEQPLPGTTVTLLPSPDALLQYLEGVKRDARDSPEAFRSAIHRMLEAQEQHERAVRAALEDIDTLRANLNKIIADRDALADNLRELPGVEPYPSDTNFLLVHLPVEDAGPVVKELANRGIFVRYFGQPSLGLQQCLRISIGTTEENEIFLRELADILQAGGAA